MRRLLTLLVFLRFDVRNPFTKLFLSAVVHQVENVDDRVDHGESSLSRNTSAGSRVTDGLFGPF